MSYKCPKDFMSMLTISRAEAQLRLAIQEYIDFFHSTTDVENEEVQNKFSMMQEKIIGLQNTYTLLTHEPPTQAIN